MDQTKIEQLNFLLDGDQSLATPMVTVELIAITRSGEPAKPLPSAPPAVVAAIVDATTNLYRRVGYEPPWIGYLAVDKGSCVGTCGFKSPPQDNRVEIAYFTFPEHESRGVATGMASQLILLARDTLPGLTIAAQTLPEANASTSILRKLGFHFVGSIEDPEDGLVWEWQIARTGVD